LLAVPAINWRNGIDHCKVHSVLIITKTQKYEINQVFSNLICKQLIND
jgi:hypothetical protein